MITAYSDDSPMAIWPSLAGYAFCFRDNSCPDESIFYYDVAPLNGDISTAQAVFVLIHGLGDESDTWRHLIPLLSAGGCRVLALDLPGFGRSVASGKVSLKSCMSAVLRFIEAVVQPQPGGPPVFLVGSSMGAVVAEAAALKKPDIASGLILIGGSIPGGPNNPGLFALAKLLLRKKWYRSYRKNPDGAWASLAPYYADLDGMSCEDKDFLRRRVMARVESPAQERAFFSIQRSLVRAYLLFPSWFARKIRHYKGKILLLWGQADRIVPLSSAQAFKALRTDIALETIPGAGHLPQQEKPIEIARFLLGFAATLYRRS